MVCWILRTEFPDSVITGVTNPLEMAMPCVTALGISSGVWTNTLNPHDVDNVQ